MRGTAHAIIGISAGMAISSALGLPPKAVVWPAIFLGSLAPDIDEDESTFTKPGKFLGSFLPKTACAVLDSFAQAISKTIKLIFGHRGLFHWPIFGVVILGLGIRYESPWVIWFGFGYLTHIVADACTVSGIPLLAPFYRESVKWSKLKTGGYGERVVIILCGIYMVYWGLHHIGGGAGM